MQAIVLARIGTSITIGGNRIPHYVKSPETAQPLHKPVMLSRTETVMKAILCGDLIEFEPMIEMNTQSPVLVDASGLTTQQKKHRRKR